MGTLVVATVTVVRVTASVGNAVPRGRPTVVAPAPTPRPIPTTVDRAAPPAFRAKPARTVCASPLVRTLMTPALSTATAVAHSPHYTAQVGGSAASRARSPAMGSAA